MMVRASHILHPRAGAVVPLVAVLVPVLLVLLGFAVDVAHMQNVRAQLRLATDAAARAAADTLARTDDVAQARTAAKQIATANRVAGAGLRLRDRDIEFGQSAENTSGKYVFTLGRTPFNAVRIQGLRTSGSQSGAVGLFFGSFIGRGTFEPRMTAVSSFKNVDVCVVLDRSTSMKFGLTEVDSSVVVATDPRTCQPPDAASRWLALDAAMRVFTSVLRSSTADEHVGIATYSSAPSLLTWGYPCMPLFAFGTPAATADLALTGDLNAVDGVVTRYTTSVWNGATNIEAGLDQGLNIVRGAGSRATAERVIILLTDGRQNQGSVMNAANRCRAAGVLVHTVTFCAAADQALMQSVASAAGGMHFHAQTSADLIAAFTTVAGEVARLTE